MVVNSLLAAGLVHSHLALSKIKEALYAAREAMKAMPQSAKALKLVGDVHASNSGGREKVHGLKICFVVIQTWRLLFANIFHMWIWHGIFDRPRSFMSQPLGWNLVTSGRH